MPAYRVTKKCKLGDIDDAEAFVRAQIKRARIRFTDDEFDDIMAIGLLILVRLYRLYDPSRDGGRVETVRTSGSRDGVASFAGYASYLMPNKIHDAYMRSHPEHKYVTDPETKKRRWVYGTAPRSLDALRTGDGWGRKDNEFDLDPLDGKNVRHVGDFVHAE
jgi:hypothetical protein